jgi:uncharacterized phage-associated protein
MKLLYLADRASLIETGYPITGDRMVSMDYGPVLSQTLNLINLGRPPGLGSSPWFDAISPRDGYDVRLEHDPGVDALSEYETELLDKLYTQYGHLDQWRLAELTHTLPEWEDPHGSALSIEPETILHAAGIDNAGIRRIIELADQRWATRMFRPGEN